MTGCLENRVFLTKHQNLSPSLFRRAGGAYTLGNCDPGWKRGHSNALAALRDRQGVEGIPHCDEQRAL